MTSAGKLKNRGQKRLKGNTAAGWAKVNGIGTFHFLEHHPKTQMKMAGVAGLEPVTSAVIGQRSNQLSYTPAKTGTCRLKEVFGSVKFCFEIWWFENPGSRRQGGGGGEPR